MRKVLSFVLVLALVLSSFSMAFADTEAQKSLSDIAGNANEEAITVDFNLGIIDGMGDGTFAPDQDVNRAQFAAMITRALAIPDSALAGYTATTFKDTTGYGWAVPYLAFCQSKGILVGDGNGNVMPGRTVSVNEAMTMVLRAIGYTNNSAALVGVWPANYVSLAQNNDLYDDVAATVNVNRANAAQIIYNALTVDKVEVASDGKTTVLSDRTNSNEDKWKIVNMLTTGLNCYSTYGTITGDEETQINLRPYVGQKVTAFWNDDDEIVAIYSVDSDTVIGEFEVSVTLENDKDNGIIVSPAGVTLEGDDDVDYDLKNSKDPGIDSLIVNGEAKSDSFAKGYVISDDTTVTINGDISGKNINRIDTISLWIENNAKKVKSGDISSIKDDQGLLGSDFTTLKDGSIDSKSFELVGVKSLDDIKADNVVAVYEKGTDGDIAKVAVGTKVVEGVVKSTKSGGEKIIVDGTTYERSDLQGSKEINSKKIEAGDTVKLYLDADGDVYDYDVTGGGNNDYAALMKTDDKYEKVKLYTEDDDSAWYELAGDVKFADFEGVVRYKDGTDTIGLVSYGLNSKGKVDSASTEGAFNAPNATVSGLTLKVAAPSGTASASYKIDSDCAVYGITKDGKDVDGYVKIGDVETGKPLGDVTVMLDDEDFVVAMLVDEDQTSKSSADAYAVVHEIHSTTNDDGDKAQEVFGFIDGASLDKITNDTNVAEYNKLTADTMGTVWKVKFDSAGYIDEMTPVEKLKANDKAQGVESIGYYANAQGVTVTAIDDNNIKVAYGDNDWLAIAPDAVVYKATLDDGDLDLYKVSNVSAIHEGYHVWLYNTIDDDDSAATDGFDVVIYLTTSDFKDANF